MLVTYVCVCVCSVQHDEWSADLLVFFFYFRRGYRERARFMNCLAKVPRHGKNCLSEPKIFTMTYKKLHI